MSVEQLTAEQCITQEVADRSDRGTTHAEGCWTWGPKHYECALERIKMLEQLTVRQANALRKQRP